MDQTCMQYSLDNPSKGWPRDIEIGSPLEEVSFNDLGWRGAALANSRPISKIRNGPLAVHARAHGIHVYHPVLMQQQKHGCMNHHCSHFCLLRGSDGYSCACPQHMMLHADERTCIEDGRPEYLLVGGGSSVLRLRYDTLGRPETETVRLDVGRIDALAYDPTGKWLYVFDGVRRSLEFGAARALDDGLRLINRNLKQIVDMDYDYVSSALYWVDAGRRSLEVYSTRTSSRAVLLRFLDGEVPLSVCVMPDLGELMVAVQQHELGGGVHVDKLGADGRGRRRLLRAAYRGVHHTCAGPHVRLRYSELHGGVYISDEGSGIIDFVRPDGEWHNWQPFQFLSRLQRAFIKEVHMSFFIYYVARCTVSPDRSAVPIPIPECS
ncbi:Putative vitellogenin receptor [Eumeta japonica]|uniref:Vitellogenin receptor n=1 Tax=Eumeta variegata TaxID=151549 RepID=A0A4C1WQX2_EUMVA|nr:Putative vitellogenin receptor [Eumeta japonica]